MSQCFPKLLQQQRAFSSLTNLELSYLARMTSDDWETNQKQGAGAIFGIAAANFSEFSAKRSQLFSEKRLDLSYFQNTSWSSLTLDPPAYEVMKECIRATAAGQQKGLRYVVVMDNESDLSIRFFWNPTNPPYKLKASGFIDGARNIDPSVRQGQLFTPGAEIFRDGPTIYLTRGSKEKRVRVVLKTNPPEVGIEPISVDVYKPSPNFRRVTVRTTFERVVDPEKFKTGEENYDAIYAYSEDLGGTVLNTTCAFRANYYHMDTCKPKGNVAYCRAHKQRSDTRSNWYISGSYLVQVERCAANCGSEPKPLPDEVEESAFSFAPLSALGDSERSCSWSATKAN
jgi:hypothetical protein